MQDTWMICYDECNAMHGLMLECCRYNWCRMHGYDLECSSKGPSWWAMERVRRFFFFASMIPRHPSWTQRSLRYDNIYLTNSKGWRGLAPCFNQFFPFFFIFFFLKIPNFCLDRSFEFSVHRECISFFVPLIFAWIAFSGFRSTGTLSIA
jgi:hypothetical protein